MKVNFALYENIKKWLVNTNLETQSSPRGELTFNTQAHKALLATRKP